MTKQIEVNILGRDFTISCPENEEENLQKSESSFLSNFKPRPRAPDNPELSTL